MKAKTGSKRFSKVENPNGKLTAVEAAFYLGVSKSSIYAAWKRGSLKSSETSYYGIQEFFTKKNLDEYRENHSYPKYQKLREKLSRKARISKLGNNG